MYFLKFFGSGYNTTSTDPRNKVFAEYHCSVCGHEEDMDVTKTWRTSFQTRDRVCPECGCLSADDKIKNLQAQINKLLADKTRIEVEIEKVERELNEIQQKEFKKDF